MTVESKSGLLATLSDWFKSRAGILNAVSDWLKLLALIVLVGEAMIIVAMRSTPASNPLTSWYPVFMLLFLVVIVIGVFVDRNAQRNADLTLTVGDKQVSVATSQQVVSTEKLKPNAIDLMFVDSQYGFVLPRPKLPQWSKPQYLETGEMLVKQGYMADLEKWDEIKENAGVIPLNKMFVEARHLIFEYGQPIDIELTDETSNKVVDTIVGGLRARMEEDGDEVDEEGLKDFRKQVIRSANAPEKSKIQNCLLISIMDKVHAQGSPVEANLGNVFLLGVKQTGEALERLVANDQSILWGSSQTLTNVLVNGRLRELTSYRLYQLVEGPDRFYQVQIFYSPQSETSLTIWEELREMFNSFQITV